MNLFSIFLVEKSEHQLKGTIMWQRLLRLLGTGINIYSFYSNPLRFIITILCIILIPYLAYIFWGSLIILGLVISGIYFIYKAVKSSYSKSQSHY